MHQRRNPYTELCLHIKWCQRFPQVQASIDIDVEVNEGISTGIITDNGVWYSILKHKIMC